MRNVFSLLKRTDKYLFIVSLLLVLVGILMIYSTTFSDPGSELLIRQIIFVTLGLGLVIFFVALDYRYLNRLSVLIYLVGLGLLIGILIFGFDVRGSKRWFDLGFFQLQPVEYMKLALIIFLAAFFSRRVSRMNLARNILLSGLFMALPLALTILQPDLGSAIVLGAIWFGMLLTTRVSKSQILIVVLIALVLATAGWFLVLQDYQKTRVLTFLNPSADPQGEGYNAIQSITAVGSGGLFGRGFARGVVSQLRFLPERQTDFIFASLAEELGLLGAMFLLVLLSVWFQRIIKIIKNSRDNFGLYLSMGVFVYFFVQTLVNIGMNIGLLPITGIPLPLISYGGSSLIISLVAIGILQSITVNSQPVRFD